VRRPRRHGCPPRMREGAHRWRYRCWPLPLPRPLPRPSGRTAAARRSARTPTRTPAWMTPPKVLHSGSPSPQGQQPASMVSSPLSWAPRPPHGRGPPRRRKPRHVTRDRWNLVLGGEVHANVSSLFTLSSATVGLTSLCAGGKRGLDSPRGNMALAEWRGAIVVATFVALGTRRAAVKSERIRRGRNSGPHAPMPVAPPFRRSPSPGDKRRYR
jgi:hypothetical protein